MCRIVVSLFLAGLLAQPALAARHARAVNGNIVVIDDKSTPRTLTTSGRDSDPVLSPDGKRVVFVRDAGRDMKDCSGLDAPAKGELWSVNADGTGARKLIGVNTAKDMRNVVCSFEDMQFASNGQLLYFISEAWVVTGAAHVYDFRTGKQHFVTDAGSLRVLNSCLNERYRDTLLVGKHKYYAMGGSYDWLWLIAPSGKELGPIGESDGTVKRECS